MVDKPRDTPLEEMISLLSAGIVRGGTSSPLLSGLNLCRPSDDFTVSVSSCVCQPCCVCKTMFPWHHPSPQALTILPPPLPHRCLSLEGRGLTRTSHLGLSPLKSLTLCSVVNLCVNFLMRDEQGTDLWDQWKSCYFNRVILLLCSSAE